MSDRLDQILGILDVGIQTSREYGYGTDFNLEACSRCQDAEPAPNGDLCLACRSYLLGDADFDPAATSSSQRLILGTQPDGPPIYDEVHQWDRERSLPPITRQPEWSWTRRREPIQVDTSAGLLCVGGPLDGRTVANDGPWLRVVVPTPISYAIAVTDPMALSIETVTYERKKVAWRDGEQVFVASCWVLTGNSGQFVIDALNTIATLASICRPSNNDTSAVTRHAADSADNGGEGQR